MLSLSSENWKIKNSPYINRFLQPDTIIPYPTNPQSFNRFSYVINNPIRYSDPSGHRECENFDGKGNCLDPKGLGGVLLREFGWIHEGTGWEDGYLRQLLRVGRKLRRYVDDLVPGKGQEWMDYYLSGITFSMEHGNDGNGQVTIGESNTPIVHIPFRTFFAENDATQIWQIGHELGHVWDYRWRNSWEGGPGDMLNDIVNNWYEGGTKLQPGDNRTGNPMANPYFDPYYLDSHIPAGAAFTGARQYGNGCTSDYLAESFVYSVFGPLNGGSVPLVPSLWIPTVITLQANALP